MPRSNLAITQADIARAIRAAKQNGAYAVEIEGNTIRIILDKDDKKGPRFPEVPEPEVDTWAD